MSIREILSLVGAMSMKYALAKLIRTYTLKRKYVKLLILTTMTGTEFNKYFDDAINQIKDAKSHWIINPSISLIELRIAKSKLEKIIKLIKE